MTAFQDKSSLKLSLVHKGLYLDGRPQNIRLANKNIGPKILLNTQKCELSKEEILLACLCKTNIDQKVNK